MLHVQVGDYFNIKGMVADTTTFVRYQPGFMPDTEIFFTHLIAGFDAEMPDLAVSDKSTKNLSKKNTPVSSGTLEIRTFPVSHYEIESLISGS